MIGTMNWIVPTKPPIFREAVLPLGEALVVTMLPGQFVGDRKDYAIGYEILAPGFTTRRMSKLICSGGAISFELE